MRDLEFCCASCVEEEKQEEEEEEEVETGNYKGRHSARRLQV